MQNEWKRQYAILAEFLGKALGPDYELVLHDLTGGSHKMLAISNRHVSGRGMDAQLSDLALEFLRTKRYETSDYILGYEGISATGERLRSSTMFIRGEDGELLGLFCVNFRAEKYSRFADEVMSFFAENFMHCGGRMMPGLVENFSESIEQRFRAIVFSMFGAGVAPERLTQKQKLEILAKLNEGGVFLVKGAIPEAAELLGTSVSSVYRYLAAIRDGGK